jgi:hypothetical protein
MEEESSNLATCWLQELMWLAAWSQRDELVGTTLPLHSLHHFSYSQLIWKHVACG